MNKSTKLWLKTFTFVIGLASFIYVYPYYFINVSSDPIDYYLFRKAVSDGFIKIVSRDTISSISKEEVIMEDVRTGERYRLEHRFFEHREFSTPEEEMYKYITDQNGDEICYKGYNQTILDFLNNKK